MTKVTKVFSETWNLQFGTVFLPDFEKNRK